MVICSEDASSLKLNLLLKLSSSMHCIFLQNVDKNSLSLRIIVWSSCNLYRCTYKRLWMIFHTSCVGCWVPRLPLHGICGTVLDSLPHLFHLLLWYCFLARTLPLYKQPFFSYFLYHFIMLLYMDGSFQY